MAQREGFEPPREIPTGFQGRRYTGLSDLCLKNIKAQAKWLGLIRKILYETYFRPRAIGDLATLPCLSI